MATKAAELVSAYGAISNAPGRRRQAQTIETIEGETSAGITGATTVAEAHEAIAAIAIADREVAVRQIGRATTIEAGGGVLGGTITAAGSAYNNSTAGTFTLVPLTGGLGVGAVATVVLGSSGQVTTVTITAAGNGYVVGDVLSASLVDLGNDGGSGFLYTVTSVS
jgi:hypothetical protein